MNPNNEQALRAARQGRSICRWLEDVTITGSYVVATSASLYFDIPAGKQVVIPHAFVGCESANEFMAGYIVGCSAIAGGGSPTQFHHAMHDHVGAGKVGTGHVVEDFIPPLVLKYSEGHRSVSMAVKATDTGTVCTFGWCGWFEDEGTLS
ncbi:unnamed protein product [marine sediment metagenome]|uniref:Uncharacterized protein n=1 Tax=marine sediment metagenome TaxID=412755 RepID=X0YPP9_9ZZZZ